MKIKKNYLKHLLLIVLLGFYGILAAGSGDKSSSSSSSSNSTQSTYSTSSSPTNKYVGTWKCIAVHDYLKSKSISQSDLKTKAYEMVLYSDGTGIVKFDGARNVTFNWSVNSSGSPSFSFSSDGSSAGLNNQGYIVFRTGAIYNSMSPTICTWFFSKK